jgi:hypothetical protein
MSNKLRVTLLLVSALIFAASYWYWFSPSAELWKVNQEIERSWGKRSEAPKTEEIVSEKKVVEDTRRLSSSGRNPIVLEGRSNFVTARDLTFVVPKTMRRIQLTIQDHLGRRLTSYTLPNSFIGIKPGQRINLKVQE